MPSERFCVKALSRSASAFCFSSVNAFVFSFAHLMYWSVVVAVLTLIGGWIFARAYLIRGFPSAWILHGIAGNVLFTVGMGAYFWSGAVVRPF